MTLFDRLKSFAAKPPHDEDGKPITIKLLPGVSDREIETLEAWLRISLSPEYRAFLKQCGGFDDEGFDPLAFTGAPYGFHLIPGLNSERIRQIAADGFGNSWFYWNSATGSDLGPIFFHEHEIPLFIYQAPTLAAFMGEWLKLLTPDTPNQIDDVHEFRIKPIRDLNKDLLTRDDATSCGDDVLREFALTQPVGSRIYDFRRAKVGDGIDLSRHDVIGVHESQPILALAGGRTGFARFLLGRRRVQAV